MLKLEHLRAYRAETHRTEPGRRLRSAEEAVAFVNERGFVYFWPINEIVMPSLWTAVAGDRPVADEHDDPGHMTWGWKDDLLGKRRWYYAKVLRKKGTMISLETTPYFYALSENYGSPEEDYLTLYQQGRLTLESKLLFEALLKEGPLDTLALRRTAHLTSRDSEARYNRALNELQASFQILPTGISQAGAFHYAYIYDLTLRHFPELLDQSRYITERQARLKLVELYLNSAGAAQERDFAKLFGWALPHIADTLQRLEQAGTAWKTEIEGQKGEWWTILKE